jgi:hypothetical protein
MRGEKHSYFNQKEVQNIYCSKERDTANVPKNIIM